MGKPTSPRAPPPLAAAPLAVREAIIAVAVRFSDDLPTFASWPDLQRRYRGLPDWPWDAQFAVGLLTWALGPGYPVWPQSAAGRSWPDWNHAEAAARLSSRWGPSFATIGSIAAHGFRNAEVVQAWGLPSDVLYYPHALWH